MIPGTINNVLQINASTPLLLGVQNSQINPVWIRLFQAIVSAIGAPNSIIADDFQTLVFTSRSPESFIAALDDEVNNLQNVLSYYRTASRALVAAESETSVILDDVTTNSEEFPIWSGSNTAGQPLHTSSTKWTFNPSTGRITTTQYAISGGTAVQVGTGMYGVSGTSVLFAVNGALAFTMNAAGATSPAALVAVTGFGCNGKTAQTAFSVGIAAPAGGVGTSAGGYDTAANRDSMIALVNNIRTALINNGIAIL